jgi:hypothetical protein
MTMANRAPRPQGLADVLEVVLDKGIVIDAYVRIALVGIELLTIDARVVIASVDTYLRYAEAVNRLDIGSEQKPVGLPGLVGQIEHTGAKQKTKGALEGVKETAQDVMASFREGLTEQRQARERAPVSDRRALRRGEEE